MRCYYNDSEERTGTYRQFESSGEPVACGCSYDGPGTERVLLMPPRKPTPDEMRQGLNDIKNVLPMAAELMRSYYLQLLEQGFDASEAIVLTTAMQTALLQGGGQQ